MYNNYHEYDSADMYFDQEHPLGAVKFHVVKDDENDSWQPDLPSDAGWPSQPSGQGLCPAFDFGIQYPSSSACGNWNATGFPVSHFPERSTQELSRLQERIDAAVIDSYKEANLERIKTDEQVIRSKSQADLQSRRELQRTEIIIRKDGGIEFSRELFSSKARKIGKFKALSGYAVYFCNQEKEKILHVTFGSSTGRCCEFFLKLPLVSEREVSRKFTSLGLAFGFSRRKEKEARILLIQELIDTAPEMEVPCHLGWNKNEGVWSYVYIGEKNWEELYENV